MSNDRVELVLASVGNHLVIDAAVDRSVSPPTVHGPWREAGRPLLVAAVSVAVVVAAVVAIAPARRAIGGWLRAGSIDVSVDPDIGPEWLHLPSFVDDAVPIDSSRLADQLGQDVPDVAGSSLGPPDAWSVPPEGGVLATWNGGETSQWIVRTADTLPGSLEKWLRGTDQATALPSLGDGGYAVAGDHVVETPHRRVRARNVVAWSDDGITFRLESSLAIEDLIAIAMTVD